MTAKHTAGPWSLPATDRECRQAIIASGAVPIRAYCRARDITMVLFSVAHNPMFDPSPEVTIANARLVAGSPELLRAARALIARDTAENWNALREAIANAAGEAS